MADDTLFPFQRLEAYKLALAFARLIQGAKIRDAELRDQATRASKSTFLNLCEGLPDDRPNVRAKYFRDADDSLHESVGAVDLARALNAVDAEDAVEIQRIGFRLRGIIRGLRGTR